MFLFARIGFRYTSWRKAGHKERYISNGSGVGVEGINRCLNACGDGALCELCAFQEAGLIRPSSAWDTNAVHRSLKQLSGRQDRSHLAFCGTDRS